MQPPIQEVAMEFSFFFFLLWTQSILYNGGVKINYPAKKHSRVLPLPVSKKKILLEMKKISLNFAVTTVLARICFVLNKK